MNDKRASLKTDKKWRHFLFYTFFFRGATFKYWKKNFKKIASSKSNFQIEPNWFLIFFYQYKLVFIFYNCVYKPLANRRRQICNPKQCKWSEKTRQVLLTTGIQLRCLNWISCTRLPWTVLQLPTPILEKFKIFKKSIENIYNLGVCQVLIKLMQTWINLI